MLNSMTAYAHLGDPGTLGTLSWELKSVNHRYLDISPRLPEEFRALEPRVREALKRRLARGKVDATLRFQPDPAAAGSSVELNRPLAEALLGQVRALGEMTGGGGEPDLVRLLSWPGVVVEQRPDFEAERERAMALLERALDAVLVARASEGRAVAAMLESRLDGVVEQVGKVREHLPAVREALGRRFEERLANLPLDLDNARLEQEVAMQLTKLDVDEELDRLDAHVAEIRRVIALDEPVGRRLDFLMQELNREANTLGSKSVAVETTGVSVELKVLIEQMREQIQNVE
jgi:uncharacterized protein (TIGR00255 family)